MKTQVVNIKYEQCDEYCGRGSKWGNPFIIGKDGNRKKVIEMYRKYFYSNKQLMEDAKKLKGKTLGCFCKPKSCHVDIIAEYAEKYG